MKDYIQIGIVKGLISLNENRSHIMRIGRTSRMSIRRKEWE